jgi:hypothetical protein
MAEISIDQVVPSHKRKKNVSSWKNDEYMDRESPGLGLSVAVAAAARRAMAPLPMDSVRRGGDRPPTIAADGRPPGLGNGT